MNQLSVNEFIDRTTADADVRKIRRRRNVLGTVVAGGLAIMFTTAIAVYNGEADRPLTDTELEACAENNLIARQTNGADLSTLSLGAIATEVQACDMDPNIGQPHKAFDEYLVIAERVDIP